ncbi:MAG: sugar ABC transporter permease [Nitrospiraceae bacterium]
MALARPQVGWRRFLRRYGWCYFFVSPALLFLGVFWAYPVLRSLALAFMWLDLRTGATTFVGLRNFQDSLANPVFWLAIRNTVVYSLVVVPVGLLTTIVLSGLVFHLGPRAQIFYKAAFYLPGVTSIAVLALIWKWLYNPSIGLLNYLLGLVGLPPQSWLGDPRLALPSLMFMALAGGHGAGIVLLTAAMGAIPQTIYDAARIDGAGPVQEFVHITVPLLRPTILYLLVISTIASFELFGPVYLMTSGGPNHATTTIVYYIYEQAFELFQFGYASAMAFLFMIALVAIAFLQYRLFSTDVEY